MTAATVVSIGPAQTILRTSVGRSDHFVVRQWLHEDGLPSDDITDLFCDDRGFLWVATRDSVVRFDGGHFWPQEAPEAHQLFYGIDEDSDGSMLLTPRSGPPVRIVHRTYQPQPLPAPFTDLPVGHLMIGPDGARWFSVKGTVLREFHGDWQTFGSESGMDPHQQATFAISDRKTVWMASNHLIARYVGNGLAAVTALGEVSYARLVSSHRGGPWVIAGSRVLKIDAEGRPVDVAILPPLEGSHYVNAACEDLDGRLWLGTRSQGLHVLEHGQDTRIETSVDDITALCVDNQGTVWAGTRSGGLNAITPRRHVLYDTSAGLSVTSVSAVCQDDAGALWAANGDGGVVRLQGGRFDKWLLMAGNRMFAAGSVTARRGGGVWAIGGTGEALFQIQPDQGGVRRAEGISGLFPVSFTARNGDLWIMTKDLGIARWRNGVHQTFGVTEGLSARGARCFSEAPDGTVLVGTNDGKVLRFDGDRFEPALPSAATAQSAINAIEVHHNEWWLGTASNGLLAWTGNRAMPITTANGLPNDDITQITTDKDGNLWCGTGSGVIRLARTELVRLLQGTTKTIPVLQLGEDDGLRPLSCQGLRGPGVLRCSDGRLAFATRQGLLLVDPSAPTLVPAPAAVAIESVRVNDQPQPIGPTLTVGPSVRKLEVQFSAVCLSAPHRVHLRYRLIGFDTDWVDGDASRSATYLRVPPADYRFEVMSDLGDASSLSNVAALEFTVRPFWWQTLWAQLAFFTAGIGAIVLAVRTWSHRHFRLRLERLERESAIAHERTRIAQNIHDDVGASLTRISLLTQTPAAPENLNRIYDTAREITRSLDEIVWAINPQYDTLEGFISYLSDFAQKFLGLAGIRCRFDIAADMPALPLRSQLRHDLFLSCREALNNVVKHSGATEAMIRVSLDARQMVIAIADNGHGIAGSTHAAADERVRAGNGIENLQHRMHRHGGNCTIDSDPGSGAVVILTIPAQALA